MERKDYKPRLIDKRLNDFLTAASSVVVEGPKWCGKTWTSSQLVKERKKEFCLGYISAFNVLLPLHYGVQI